MHDDNASLTRRPHSNGASNSAASNSAASNSAASNSAASPSKSWHILDFLRIFSAKNDEPSLRQTFEEIIEEHDDRAAPINSDEKQLIQNILHLGNLTARDVMVPRADIVFIAVNSPTSDILKTMMQQPHSRYPVYDKNPDDVIGMVHIKDVLSFLARQDQVKLVLRDIYRQILVVSPNMRILDLLLEMRVKRLHMAVVIDEYGGIDGLITIEDLVEQIVGEIQDEHDIDEQRLLQKQADGSYFADPRLEIEEMEQEIGVFLTDSERAEDIDTLNGYILWQAGRVPSRGELILHATSGLEIEILDADPRRVKKVALRNIPVLAAQMQTD